MSRCSAPGPCAPCRGSGSPWCVDRPVAVYSGMVPGFVAGQYRRDELEIDVRPLALRAGARFIVTPAVGLDPRERLIHLEGRPPLRYDTAAFDVGSTVAGLALPGVREHALATRPIGRFVEHVDALIARARERGRCRLVVVGAGAGGRGAGLRLPRAARARRRARRLRAAAGVGAARAARLSRRHRAPRGGQCPRARHRDPAGRAGGGSARAELVLADGERIPFDELAWVAGAASLAALPRAPGWRWTSAASCACGGRSSSSSTRTSLPWEIAPASRARRIWPRPASTPCARGPCSPPISARASWGSRSSPIAPSATSSRSSTWATAAPSAASGA